VILELPHTHERDMWLKVAELIRPRDLSRPSEWAEANVTLTAEQSPKRPGPFRCDFMPWTRAILDILVDNPGKKGVVCMKRQQVGWTRAALIYFAWSCLNEPGPFLFLIGDEKKAKHYSVEHFDPMVEGCPALKKIFDQAAQTKRTTMEEKPYTGGRVDMAGGGSAGDVTSKTYTLVALDELELVYDNFPRKVGDPIVFAEGRMATVRDIGRILMFSHPRRSDRGIALVFNTRSDMRAWMFDCPHCGAAVDPTWKCVHVEGLKGAGPKALEFGTIDPDKVVFRCPACTEVITDAERARAVWPANVREGGSGRLVSRLPAEDAAKREFVGVAINGLADPTITVAELALRLSNLQDDVARGSFFNQELGEPYESSAAAVTVEHVRERLEASRGLVLVPGGRLGVQFIAVGADIQFPIDRPTVYARAEGYAPQKYKYVTHFDKLSGWDAFQAWLEELDVAIAHESGNGVGGRLGVSIATIDCAFATGQVLDFCRRNIYSKVTGAKIILLPVRYVPHVKANAPAIMPSVEKRTDPRRPELGPLDLYDLHRDTWVDREMRRWLDERILVVGRPPIDLAAHITANVQVPAPDEHGWGNAGLIWEKVKDKRDDWMQAGALGEAGAVLRMNADRLMELVSQDEVVQQADGSPGGWFGRYTSGRSLFRS
jgi:phage terminase large subunit GpA-like protein